MRVTSGESPTQSQVHDRDRGAPLPALAAKPLVVLVAVLAALQTAVSGRYGFHRDELYFLVAGQHPAWGYVDQPPLTPLLARASVTLFGDTLLGLRVLATLTCVLTVVVAALLARELGGDREAQLLAAGATAVSSMVLVTGHLVSTQGLDILAWLVISLFVLRLLRTGHERWYLAIGAAVGIAILNKYLVVLLLAGLLISLLAVGPRQPLRSSWLLAGAAIALALVAPNLWWQAAHDWPQFTVAAGIDRKVGFENRLLFVPFQLIYLAPPFVPIWVAGLLRLWRDQRLRWARAFALAYPLLALVVLVTGGKAYYIIGLLIVLMAAGAQPAVDWARRGRGECRWLIGGLALAAAVNVVVSLPVLPVNVLGPVNAMNKEQGEQVGWQALVHTVAAVWQQIPVAQRSRAVIFTQNYGEAGAIARYGPHDGLPRAYSGHMGFADWGRPADSSNGPVLLVRYPGNRALERHFTGCRQVAAVDNGDGLDNDEQGTVIELCAGTTAPWSVLWSDLRHLY
ncbi:MAG: hypothetical protein DLM58_15705 [Pseudonocardiales bacterium]|nr:MAG: hypothetical protein DLM58_15705 [Pseudonocardiales bacterium]